MLITPETGLFIVEDELAEFVHFESLGFEDNPEIFLTFGPDPVPLPELSELIADVRHVADGVGNIDRLMNALDQTSDNPVAEPPERSGLCAGHPVSPYPEPETQLSFTDGVAMPAVTIIIDDSGSPFVA